MIVKIRKIGNSQGVLIPKILLIQCAIEDKAVVEVKDHKIIISPTEPEKRKGWAESFRQMAENEDDELTLPDVFEDLDEWTWK